MKIEVDEQTYKMLNHFVKEQEYPFESYSEAIKQLIYVANWDRGTPFENKVWE